MGPQAALTGGTGTWLTDQPIRSGDQPKGPRPQRERRKEVPQDTKERIVAGVYRALVRDGHANTTVKDIAVAAGATPGLVRTPRETS